MVSYVWIFAVKCELRSGKGSLPVLSSLKPTLKILGFTFIYTCVEIYLENAFIHCMNVSPDLGDC